MRMQKRILTTLALSLSLLSAGFCAAKEVSSQDLYNKAIVAYKDKRWKEVARCTTEMVKNHPKAPFLSDLYYYSGEAYYNIGEYDLANEAFSRFLDEYASLNHFDDAIQYKFYIAQQFEKGARKHMFGSSSLPRWADAREDAYAIYDEVIGAAGRTQVGAEALFSKARMQQEDYDFKEAILSYQTLIRRFPKHHLGADSYVKISESYKAMLSKKAPDTDVLDQALLNQRKFSYDFPSEERLVQVEQHISEMMDVFAYDLWKAAEYFDKKGKTSSAILYYRTIVKRYPQSQYAHNSLERLTQLSALNADEIADFETQLINL